MVVMPHGGPHDVRDRRQYDPFVQYLASWGFAVLQPNFRGSTGYGLEFQEAIKKEWARGIEDDIDAAVEHAMSMPEIDGDRLCIIGTSYGGFSALASVVRHKDRYRCAISINGASDIPLLYDSSDMGDSKRVMEFYEEYVGDLETEREKLVAVSPAYAVAGIEAPVFMIYGTEDRRVDPDHSHRMLLMLETYGKEHDSLAIEKMRHSPRRLEWIHHCASRETKPDTVPDAHRGVRPRSRHRDRRVGRDPSPTKTRQLTSRARSGANTLLPRRRRDETRCRPPLAGSLRPGVDPRSARTSSSSY